MTENTHKVKHSDGEVCCGDDGNDLSARDAAQMRIS